MSNKSLFVDTGSHPLLISTVCKECDYVDFPAQSYGCRRCGSYGSSLKDYEIETHGSVLTSSEVHSDPSGEFEVPYRVAVIDLDAGPVTRVTMLDTAELQRGDRVIATLTGGPSGDELRFQKVGDENA